MIYEYSPYPNLPRVGFFVVRLRLPTRNKNLFRWLHELLNAQSKKPHAINLIADGLAPIGLGIGGACGGRTHAKRIKRGLKPLFINDLCSPSLVTFR